MDTQQVLANLEIINGVLNKIRVSHAEATSRYFVKKAEYEILVGEFIGIEIKKNPKASITSLREIAKSEFQEVYRLYKEAKGMMEAQDRNLKNLDAQRRIAETLLNNS